MNTAMLLIVIVAMGVFVMTLVLLNMLNIMTIRRLRNKKPAVFVTTMHRYGNRENHSYVLGVWSSEALAKLHGETEQAWRGDKYTAEVTRWTVDASEHDDLSEKVEG